LKACITEAKDATPLESNANQAWINSSGMDRTAADIHKALEQVSQFRQRRLLDPALASASTQLKRFQAARFKATYADLLYDPRYRTATSFFLKELYSDLDYTERDQQFARIANTIARLFPQAVVDTAAALADVHALTEQLDDKMAAQWLAHEQPLDVRQACALYISCWRAVADPGMRARQLEVVLHLGEQLNRLTGKLGLRSLLRMMRRPAAAAGLSSLQQFLESGFDAFADMRGAEEFLSLVKTRESDWTERLFHSDAVTCETQLMQLIAPDGV